jgi:VanZ family protein
LGSAPPTLLGRGSRHCHGINYSPRELLQVCEKLLAAFSPASDASPLDDLLKLLYDQRQYFSIGIYFVLSDKVVRQAMLGRIAMLSLPAG